MFFRPHFNRLCRLSDILLAILARQRKSHPVVFQMDVCPLYLFRGAISIGVRYLPCGYSEAGELIVLQYSLCKAIDEWDAAIGRWCTSQYAFLFSRQLVA